MTTTVIFSDVADGQIQSTAGTWAGAQAGASLAVDTTTATVTYGVQNTFNIARVALAFDTSVVFGQTISSVSMATWVTKVNGTGPIGNFEAYQQSWGTTLTTADWIDSATLRGGTIRATLGNAVISTGAYNLWRDSGMAAIFVNGLMYLMLSYVNEGATAPTGIDNMNVSTGDATGTANDPQLTVVSTAASAEHNRGGVGPVAVSTTGVAALAYAAVG